MRHLGDLCLLGSDGMRCAPYSRIVCQGGTDNVLKLEYGLFRSGRLVGELHRNLRARGMIFRKQTG